MTDRADIRRDAVIMFFSAAIFGFFGFGYLKGQGTYPQELFQLMIWSLRGGAVGFALAGLLAVVGLPASRVLYSIVGGLTAVVFVVIGVWHLLVPTLPNLTGGIFLFFGLFNGNGVYRALKPAKPRPGS
ncbi:MAG: hypothetical protein ACF8NJ_02475 [Phycisphaerales bacterium JB038]